MALEAAETQSLGGLLASSPTQDGWTPAEFQILQSLSIDSLPEAPEVQSNHVADDPRAAELGRLLFFDPGLSRGGQVACASCHLPELYFSDGQTVSTGIGKTNRNAPTVVGAAHARWQFWDGRRDSLWAQALAPFETVAEMGSTRLEVVRYALTHPRTRGLYEDLFGSDLEAPDIERLPARASPYGDRETKDAWARMRPEDRRAVDRAFSNVGKAIEAYERKLRPGAGRFDVYVRSLAAANTNTQTSTNTNTNTNTDADSGGENTAVDSPSYFGEAERLGLRLFIDDARTQCLRCHNGPLFTDGGFHHVGTSSGDGPLPDMGRFLGLQSMLVDPFNCLGPFSDADPEECRELRFLNKDHLGAEVGKFKTPTLRGAPHTAPYLHDGRFGSLAEVIEHYREPPSGGSDVHELIPLELSSTEVAALVAFLDTLDGGVDADRKWLTPPGAPPFSE